MMDSQEIVRDCMEDKCCIENINDSSPPKKSAFAAYDELSNRICDSERVQTESEGNFDRCITHQRSEMQSSNPLELNRFKLKKIFNKHVFFSGSKGICKDELNKILMNLNIFPGLVSNLEIKKIIEEIEAIKAQLDSKSPRYQKDATEENNKFISYSTFEEILTSVALKSFVKSKKTTKSEAINKFLSYIKEPSKIVYFVRLTTANPSVQMIDSSRTPMSKTLINKSTPQVIDDKNLHANDGSMSKPTEMQKLLENNNCQNFNYYNNQVIDKDNEISVVENYKQLKLRGSMQIESKNSKPNSNENSLCMKRISSK